MDIQVKFFPSRKRDGKKSFIVDTSNLVAGGRRNYFASKEEAQAFADHLKKELTPNLEEAWDWDFQTLRDRFVQHLDQQYEDEEISRSSLIEKRRHSKTFVALSLADKPLANVKVRDLTTGQIRLQLMNELKQGRSIKTVKNILGNVRVMFDYALDCGCRNSNPALGVKAKGTKKTGINRAKRIQPEIIDAVIAAMPEQWALRARFAATTGLRQGEQRALTWGHVDLENNFVRVEQAVKHRGEIGETKTYKGNRKVPLTPDVKQLLQELYLRTGRPDDDQLVFPSATGNVLSDSRFIVAIHEACDKAGVEHIRWHDLRHYYASRILQAFNGDWWTVTNLMGHTSIQTTTLIYGHWLESAEQDQRVADTISQAF